MSVSVMDKELVKMPANFILRALPVVGSTNDVASDYIKSLNLQETNQISNAVIWAGEQTGGRGRTGRNWSSPVGNLYCSIALPRIRSLQVAAQLSFLTAISMRAAISDLCPALDLKCKWPNDLLVKGAKVCGILLEAGLHQNEEAWVVIGTGVNVAFSPENLTYKTFAIKERYPDITLENILTAYLKHFSMRYHQWCEGDKISIFEPIRKEWLQHCYGLEEQLTANLANGNKEVGIFKDIDQQGALILQKEDSRLVQISAGDVFFKDMEKCY